MHKLDEEELLRCLISMRWIGMYDAQKKNAEFLEEFVDKGLVRLFVFVNCILDEKQLSDNFFGPIDYIFSILSDRNGVSCAPKWDRKPAWPLPGIPCLLESLIQLISAEKTKYSVYKNRWPSVSGFCWHTASDHAQKLLDIALKDLSNTPLYADISLYELAKVIRNRAQAVGNISDAEAKQCFNYMEVNGDPPGSFKPMPGHCQVLIAAAKKHVNFIKELKILMEVTGGHEMFRRYLSLSKAM
jgi:hypothetical protein